MEDLEDFPDLEDLQEWREQQWYAGYHTTRENDKLKISEMTTNHLINTINLFSGYDTTPLENELKKRNK